MGLEAPVELAPSSVQAEGDRLLKGLASVTAERCPFALHLARHEVHSRPATNAATKAARYRRVAGGRTGLPPPPPRPRTGSPHSPGRPRRGGARRGAPSAAPSRRRVRARGGAERSWRPPGPREVEAGRGGGTAPGRAAARSCLSGPPHQGCPGWMTVLAAGRTGKLL